MIDYFSEENQDSIETTIEDIENSESINNSLSSNMLEDEIGLFKEFFNIQRRLFYNHYPGIFDPYYNVAEFERIIMQAFIKSSHLLYNVHTLIISGNYGTANLIQRQVFEFLLIGKYMSKKRDGGIANKWLDNNQFSVYKKIIKLLISPQKNNFNQFWNILCDFTHATTYSNQVGLNFKRNRIEIKKSYYFLLLLMRCNYHLLNSCFFNPRLIYRSSYFGEHRDENKELRVRAKVINIKIYGKFSKLGKSLIRDYESKWVLRNLD